MTSKTRVRQAMLCAAVAILAGMAAALGVFARGDGSFITVTSVRGEVYEMATTGVYAFNAERVVAEGVGWDIFTLVIAVPVLLLITPAVACGSFRGRLFALGMLGYFLYAYLEYAVTWAFGPLFLAFVAIFAASLGGIAWIGTSVAREGIEHRFGGGFPRRAWAVLSVTMGLLLTVMWLQRIIAGLRIDLATAALEGETTMTVQALDLGLVIPLLVFTAVLAWRRSSVGYVLSAILSVTFVGMAAAITGMLLSAWAIEGTLEIVPVAIFAAAALSAIVIGTRMYRGVLAATALRESTRLQARQPVAI